VPPEITIRDFERFLTSNTYFGMRMDPQDAVAAWQEKNGISDELLHEIGEALEGNFIARFMLAREPLIDLNSIIFNTSLTGFQLGWEAALEFRRVSDDV
jgi:hypothetical protein